MSQASLYESCTVLEIGSRGKLRGAQFVLAGRTAVRSEAGGLWNEWALAFDDGREAVLAEALGGFTLLFERSLAPAYATLGPGQPLETGFVVVERGRAKRIASWGNVPDVPRTYRYADLSGSSGESATLDYGPGERGTDAHVFVGRRMRLSDLGLSPRAARARFLPAPGGDPPEGVELWLQPGDEGELETAAGARKRARFRVIGIVHRSIKIERERFTWEEYVLHSPVEGLRWLVVSEGHWNLVESVDAGQVTESERGASLGGAMFRSLSRGKARVEWATGELPWHVAIGDLTETRDYVRAPHVLSCESTEDEITWSFGTYMPSDTIARAFGKRLLPRTRGRAPNQPKAPRAAPKGR
jgi:hypothetical protein